MSPWCVWTGAGQRRDRLAGPGSPPCWQPSAMFSLLGRCLEEPHHQGGDKLRIIRDRTWLRPGVIAAGRGAPRPGSGTLPADQRVGGSLQDKDRPGDARKPRRDLHMAAGTGSRHPAPGRSPAAADRHHRPATARDGSAPWQPATVRPLVAGSRATGHPGNGQPPGTGSRQAGPATPAMASASAAAVGVTLGAVARGSATGLRV
jgi:hypothetical protein